MWKNLTYSKSNDSRWKGKEAILGHAFGESNEEVSDPEKDPPQKSAEDNATGAPQKESIPLEERLDLQPNCLAVTREGRGHRGGRFIKYLLRKAFVEIGWEESEGAIAEALLRVEHRRRGAERGGIREWGFWCKWRIGDGGVAERGALVAGGAAE